MFSCTIVKDCQAIFHIGLLFLSTRSVVRDLAFLFWVSNGALISQKGVNGILLNL